MKLSKTLKNKPYFTTKEAKKYGISPRMLSYYVKIGKIERIAHGMYRHPDYEPKGTDFQWLDLATAARKIEGGVICLISALSYYELTDEIARVFWIAVDNDNSKAKFPMTRIVRMRNMQLGVKHIVLAGFKVKIFDIERTIVDSFRYLDLETSIKALKIYLKGEKGKPDLRKLNRYIFALRASKAKEYIKALII